MKLCPGHERLSSDYSDWKCGAQCRFCQGTCQKCFPPEPATPTPSITVGTQVRLTGVVTRIPGDPDVEDPEFPETEYRVQIVGAVGPEGETGVWFRDATLKNLEVIRQPFKRGEVVWSCGAVATGEQYVVFNDENNGRVDVVHCDTGTATKGNDASRFERRP